MSIFINEKIIVTREGAIIKILDTSCSLFCGRPYKSGITGGNIIIEPSEITKVIAPIIIETTNIFFRGSFSNSMGIFIFWYIAIFVMNQTLKLYSNLTEDTHLTRQTAVSL